jgi:hypothetical protein
VNHAYKLSDRKDWQTVFGSPETEYTETYTPRPYSKSFVQHFPTGMRRRIRKRISRKPSRCGSAARRRMASEVPRWKALDKTEYIHW